MITKEVRLLVPGVLLALVGPCALALVGPLAELAEFRPAVFALGCLYMGAAGFGAEFDHGTLAGYLALPRTRWQLYRSKMLVLGVMLVAATAGLALFGGGLEPANWLIWVPPLAFCTGPLLAMLARGTFAGLAFCAGLPMALVLACWAAWQAALRLSGSGPETPEWSASLDVGFRAATPFYMLTGLLAGWYRFRTLQITENAGNAHSGAGAVIGYPGAPQLDALLRRWLPVSTWASLVRKELRLQTIPWLLAGFTAGLWFLWAITRGFVSNPGPGEYSYAKEIAAGCLAIGFLTVLMTGASVVSEERQCGTLSWQLTQPCSVRKQWWIKLGTALLLALLLGVALPIGLLLVTPGWPVLSHEIFRSADDYAQFTWGVAGVLGVAIYGSSLSRTSAKAAIVALLIALGILVTAVATLASLAVGITSWIEPVLQDPWLQSPGWMAPAWALEGGMIAWTVQGGYWFTFTLVVMALVALSHRNFRQEPPDKRRGALQLAGLGLVVVCISGLACLPFLWLHASTRIQFQLDRAAAERAEAANAARFVRDINAATTPTVPRPHILNPELMRRYGLRPPAPTPNPAERPETAPEKKPDTKSDAADKAPEGQAGGVQP